MLFKHKASKSDKMVQEDRGVNKCTLKSKTFGPKSFGKKTSDKNFRTLFQELRTKKLSDKYDIKKQARYQKDVKTDCDSIININLRKVHGNYYIYKDI